MIFNLRGVALADVASAATVIAAAIPEPGVSKALALMAGLVTVLAKRAKRKNKALGVKWCSVPVGGLIPFFHDDM
ncbi:hypothetical protein ABZ408_37145 [Streptomyces tibetensis]|uniref:PEP-CTERM protein-sorting domain-containing protein n=1 Tax=Streptomyces tibetensis TaxID=2382123 RepID=A0ABW6NAB2_9ACTN